MHGEHNNYLDISTNKRWSTKANTDNSQWTNLHKYRNEKMGKKQEIEKKNTKV